MKAMVIDRIDSLSATFREGRLTDALAVYT